MLRFQCYFDNECTDHAVAHIQWDDSALVPSKTKHHIKRFGKARVSSYRSTLHFETFFCEKHSWIRVPTLMHNYSGEFFYETVDDFVARMVELDLTKTCFGSGTRANDIERSRYRAVQKNGRRSKDCYDDQTQIYARLLEV